MDNKFFSWNNPLPWLFLCIIIVLGLIIYTFIRGKGLFLTANDKVAAPARFKEALASRAIRIKSHQAQPKVINLKNLKKG